MAKKEDRSPGLVAIVYVGKKPLATDNVARSGKSWNGKGDVQHVTPAQAALLCQHPDQWQVASGRLPTDKDIEQALLAIEPSKGGLGVASKQLADMNEDELVAHADRYYGITLDPKTTADEMRRQLSEAVVNAGLDADFERNNAIVAE